MTSTKWMGISPESSTQDDVLQAIRELTSLLKVLLWNTLETVTDKFSDFAEQTSKLHVVCGL